MNQHTMIDITAMDKVRVLQALHDYAKPQGLGFIHYPSKPLSRSEAKHLLSSGVTYFDYLNGRTMKVDLSANTFDATQYDRNNGCDAAWHALESVRQNMEFHTEYNGSLDRKQGKIAMILRKLGILNK